MSRLAGVVVVLLAVLATGCPTQRIRLGLKPPETKVSVNGQPMEGDFFWDRRETVELDMTAPCHRPMKATLAADWDGGCVAGWVIGGLIIWPLLIGIPSCHRLPQTYYSFELKRLPNCTLDGCVDESDCKGNRLCVDGRCVEQE